MNIKKILEEFNHNSDTLNEAIGVSNSTANTLRDTLQDWNKELDSYSRVVQRILSHESLLDAEKIFCLVEYGKIIILQRHFDEIIESINALHPENILKSLKKK